MSYADVREAMKKLLKIFSEFEKQNIAVTYDLAIAKLAHQMQAKEPLEFRKIFILLG